MDPMSLAEEERRIKEEVELRELHDTVVLDDLYFASRDLMGKGKDVHTGAKQRKIVQTVAATIKFNASARRKTTGSLPTEEMLLGDGEEGFTAEIDLTSKPRTFIASGPINRYEPDKILRRFTKRYLFIFNDVMLITSKKDNAEIYDVLQVLWVKDLRIKHSHGETEEEKLSFEIIVNKGRNRPRATVLFTCENEGSWKQWVEDIENTLLAYHRQTDISKQIGWFHEIIQGNFHSAAYLGDLVLMRKHLKAISDGLLNRASSSNGHEAGAIPSNIDASDRSGMSALHWAALRGHEVCVRLLLDRGADVDVMQKGLNTPLLLAAAGGHETIARLLIERGADVRSRNHRGHDAVFMAVLYGHASKGLPWLIQLFNAKGLDLNEVDSAGATPLHLCAEKNLARPVRMLVDSGADVNARHGKTQLTPIQMACNHANPDMETIRSFLDKGAYPNWKDLQGRTAFDLALRNQQGGRQSSPMPAVVFTPPGADVDINQVLMSPGSKKYNEDNDGTNQDEGLVRRSTLGGTNAIGGSNSNDKWRSMEDTLHIVGDWAVRSLPALLELCKKGARFDPKDIEFLRPSFRAAVMEAKEVWDKKAEPANFAEFVMVREQSGEDLRLHKAGWSKDKASSICQLCSDSFGLTNRRHHCRACGILCCDKCSTKRLQLSGAMIVPEVEKPSKDKDKDKKKDDIHERVCDGCFNRLNHEASQPSADHFRIRQLKQCALDVIKSIEELIDSLDSPDGEISNFQSSIRETQQLTKELEGWNVSGKTTNRKSLLGLSSSQSSSSVSPPRSSAPNPVEVLKNREARLYKTEDIIAKFLESSVGYHRISKKLVEQKIETGRLWGSNGK